MRDECYMYPDGCTHSSASLAGVVTVVQPTHSCIFCERDELRAEVERMRPVYLAALMCRLTERALPDPPGERRHREFLDIENELARLIDVSIAQNCGSNECAIREKCTRYGCPGGQLLARGATP